ncbi:MAG TPA: hypothetical protein VMU04_10105 [Candidatus Acidoferrum sp.]|nr:hypothetical protein [Candidatus Acidoferrum sp.]
MKPVFDAARVKLGARKPHPALRAKLPMLENYLDLAKLPDAPPAQSFKAPSGYPMWANDQYGDCTCAAYANKALDWCTAARLPFTLTTQQVLQAYAAITGFNPVTGANDNGASAPQVLEYCRTQGIGGHKIEAYAFINPNSPTLLRIGHNLFGGLYFTLDMPAAWQQQTNGGTWFVPESGTETGPGVPGSWGGHAVDCYGYDESYFYVPSWTLPLAVTVQAVGVYGDLIAVLMGPDWAQPGKVCPTGFAYQDLKSDLGQLQKIYQEVENA